MKQVKSQYRHSTLGHDMVSGVSGCDFTGLSFTEGALCSCLTLQFGSTAFGLCTTGI